MIKLQTLRDHVIKCLDDAYVNQSRYYNLRRRAFRLKPRDLVLARCRGLSSKTKRIAAKLNPKCQGPYRVSKVLSPTVYEISDLAHVLVGKTHIEDLKPYVPPTRNFLLSKVISSVIDEYSPVQWRIIIRDPFPDGSISRNTPRYSTWSWTHTLGHRHGYIGGPESLPRGDGSSHYSHSTRVPD